MSRGRLRIYLGAAPGVGKTFAMLNEGWRASERGRDVVVAFLETHGRPHTAEQVRDLEIVPRRHISYRGQDFEEMDIDAVLARRPSVALVDELAHTNVPGSRNAKRWQDVEELLAAGINVVSTVNVQHLESLNDVVRQITGAAQRETVPDRVVRDADQLELVDMSPESLRRRMAHGNVYGPDRVDAALANYFRVGNLTALRELALLWVADRVDEGLQDYRERHGIAEPWETKERVVVALTGSPQGERLIRRGARIAARARAELVGVHVRPTDGMAQRSGAVLDRHREVLAELGGRYAEVSGSDVPSALVAFARAENATQLLLGATARSRWAEAVRGSVINEVIRRAEGIDIHVISPDDPAGDDDEGGSNGHGPRLPRPVRRRHLARLPARRRTIGWVLAVVGMPALVLALVPLRSQVTATGALPELLLAVVVVAVVGGLGPALTGAVIGFVLADYYLIPPLHSFTIGRAEDAAGLVVFLVTAAVVAVLMDLLARRGTQVARAGAEAEALARLAGGAVLAPGGALPGIIDQLRAAFAAEAVAVLAPDGGGGWRVEAAAGRPVPERPDGAAFEAELDAGTRLVLTGPALGAEDRRLLDAFVGQLRLVQVSQGLRAAADEVGQLAEANELRSALLAAVSHDLRTPLASIRAAATSLRSREVQWRPEQLEELYETIDDESARLAALVADLLDMSRIQAGAATLATRPVALEEVVFSALASLSSGATRVKVEVPETLAPVLVDPDLLERSVANLLANALAWGPAAEPVLVTGSEVRTDADAGTEGASAGLGADRRHLLTSSEPPTVELRIVDRGPGIPADARDEVFLPFHRRSDASRARRDGVGLGLPVARGFVDLMGGSVELDDTPGGGLTAIVRLPVAG